MGDWVVFIAATAALGAVVYILLWYQWEVSWLTLHQPLEENKTAASDREASRISRAASIARLASHEGFFGEMKRTSRSNSLDDWGHAWISPHSQPHAPAKRGREDRVEADYVQIRRNALRLCLEQARGSQGIYRADYGVSRERYVEGLQEQQGKQGGAHLQREDLGGQGGLFGGETQSKLFTQKHDQGEVGAMFAVPPTSFPQSTGLFGSSTSPTPAFSQSSVPPNPFPASDSSPDTVRKRRS